MPQYDDEPRDEFEDGSKTREYIVRDARGTNAIPGMLLIMLGLIGLLIVFTRLALSFTQPDIIYIQVKKLVESGKPGPDRDEALKDLEDEKADIMLNTPLSIGSCIVGALLNICMVLGGVNMRQLRSYSLSIVGAICGIIPISGCICCAMPVGIWALVVLMNADVHRAFKITAQSG